MVKTRSKTEERRAVQGRSSDAGILERIAWIAGIVLLLIYSAARADGELARRAAIHRFEAGIASDGALWSPSRLRAYEVSRNVPVGPVLAVLRVPSVQLEVPLYADTSELHLNRGVGLIEHMSPPGERGNLGIAGHRDGFFRVLAHLQAGDSIEVRTREVRYQYRVTFISIVTATDTRLLAPTPEPAVTLVTCFPFYFVGRAPHRFVVRGTLVSTGKKS